jgi:hypothetical protein
VLPGWENFAVISGGAAGALTGLLFVARPGRRRNQCLAVPDPVKLLTR